MIRCCNLTAIGVTLGLSLLAAARAQGPPPEQAAEAVVDYVAAPWFQLNDNGAWSWFMDERAIVDRGMLIVGSVRAVGKFRPGSEIPGAGNVEVSTLRLADGAVDRVVLHP
ncbi:MAG TPA: hypothetical protein VEQ85_07520, partial [Lacipirellulaceae bacterium]|nr:hypothetical protein [Lacipirellulaceae bacterium]